MEEPHGGGSLPPDLRPAAGEDHDGVVSGRGGPQHDLQRVPGDVVQDCKIFPEPGL